MSDFFQYLNLTSFCIFAFLMMWFDIREKRLPNKLMFPAIILTATASVTENLLEEDWRKLLINLAVVALISICFLLVSLFYPDALGMGDVKGILLLGIALSGLKINVYFFALSLSFIAASIFILISRKLFGKKMTHLAFGPFIFTPGMILLGIAVLV